MLKLAIILAVVFVIFPVVSAVAGLPFGVFANIFGKQYKYSLKSYQADVTAQTDPLLVGCETLPVKKEMITITAHDGIKLVGEAFGQGSQKTAICFHGYRSNPQRDFAGICQSFLRRGYNVLCVHQRAHGCSGGKHCVGGLIEQYDVQDWLNWCEQAGFGCQFVLYGISMGGATIGYSLEWLQNTHVAVAVIDCAFSSIYEEMKTLAVKKIPPVIRTFTMQTECLLVRLKFHENLRKTVAQSLCCNHTIPTLFLGGGADSSIPVFMVQDNYEATAAEKQLLFAEHAVHGKVFFQPEIEQKLFQFLDKYSNQTKDKEEKIA
jgi:pimeloyl-ACP methyl ester carboxylesterase